MFIILSIYRFNVKRKGIQNLKKRKKIYFLDKHTERNTLSAGSFSTSL